MFSLTCAWINGSVNNREAGDLRRDRAHYDVRVMDFMVLIVPSLLWFKANIYSCPILPYPNQRWIVANRTLKENLSEILSKYIHFH